MRRRGKSEAQYFSKDFEWDEISLEIDALPYHFNNPSTTFTSAEQSDGAWSRFHIRHSTSNFFKERRYLPKEFPELVTCRNAKLLEVGCGNGSTALSILCGQEHISMYACDCSSEALTRASDAINAVNIDSIKNRFYTFLCDFSVHGVSEVDFL